MKTRITIHLNHHLRTWIDPHTGQHDQNGLQAEAFSGHQVSTTGAPGVRKIIDDTSRFAGYEVVTAEHGRIFVPLHSIAAVITADCRCAECGPLGDTHA